MQKKVLVWLADLYCWESPLEGLPVDTCGIRDSYTVIRCIKLSVRTER